MTPAPPDAPARFAKGMRKADADKGSGLVPSREPPNLRVEKSKTPI